MPVRAEPVLTPLVGVVNGLVTGVTGTFVIPIVMYLEALGLDRDEMVQMMGITFGVSTVALAGVLLWHGAYRVDAGLVSAAAVVPAIAGMMLVRAVACASHPRHLSHVAARRARRHRPEAARDGMKPRWIRPRATRTVVPCSESPANPLRTSGAEIGTGFGIRNCRREPATARLQSGLRLGAGFLLSGIGTDRAGRSAPGRSHAAPRAGMITPSIPRNPGAGR